MVITTPVIITVIAVILATGVGTIAAEAGDIMVVMVTEAGDIMDTGAGAEVIMAIGVADIRVATMSALCQQ